MQKNAQHQRRYRKVLFVVSFFFLFRSIVLQMNLNTVKVFFMSGALSISEHLAKLWD